MKQKITNILFALFLLILFGLHFRADRAFSKLENRYLASSYTLSWQTVINGEFMNEFEEYIEDQYPLRDILIKTKNLVERILMKKDINQTYIGKNDFYFSKDDTDEREQFTKNIEYLETFQNQINIPLTFLSIYSSYSIYDEYLPKYAIEYDERKYQAIVEQSRLHYIDTYDSLKKHKNENDLLYFKSDHHWTSTGAYYAYVDICNFFHLTPYAFTRKIADKTFYGTLYSNAPLFQYPGDAFVWLEDENRYTVTYPQENKNSDTMYVKENLLEKDMYTFFLGGNHPEVIIHNDNGEGNLLIVRDSFTNALAPFLANHYKNIYLIDLRYYHESIKRYIEEHRVDHMLVAYNLAWLSKDNNIYPSTRM